MNVFELAINQANEGMEESFYRTREKFVQVLEKEKATLNEGKWKPIFTVVPDLNLDSILIGMTHWNSISGFAESASRLMPQQVAIDYFSTFTPLAYALLETIDHQDFDMESIKNPGSVVEFAIRKGRSIEAFGESREHFFNSLNKFNGYSFSREFKVHKLNEQGIPNLAENTQAVIIVWKNAEAFQEAAPLIFASQEYQEFAEKIEVETYFASLPI